MSAKNLKDVNLISTTSITSIAYNADELNKPVTDYGDLVSVQFWVDNEEVYISIDGREFKATCFIELIFRLSLCEKILQEHQCIEGFYDLDEDIATLQFSYVYDDTTAQQERSIKIVKRNKHCVIIHNNKSFMLEQFENLRDGMCNFAVLAKALELK